LENRCFLLLDRCERLEREQSYTNRSIEKISARRCKEIDAMAEYLGVEKVDGLRYVKKDDENDNSG
jgi:Flp pilus assembly CpaE family ATPase